MSVPISVLITSAQRLFESQIVTEEQFREIMANVTNKQILESKEVKV